MKTIFCFGDSITFGEKDLELGGWVNRLKIYYLKSEVEKAYQETFVYNLAIASETTDGLHLRVEKEVASRRIGKHPSIVILCYGYNDIRIHKDKNLVPIQYFERNLIQSIEKLKRLNQQIVLMTLPSLCEEIDGKLDRSGCLRFAKDLLSYNKVVLALAEKYNCELIELGSLFDSFKSNDVTSNDYLHFNAQGHKIIFEKVLAKLSLLG